MSKRKNLVEPFRPDLEAAAALEVAAKRFRAGYRAAMLEAGRIALWYMNALGSKPAAVLGRALDLAIDRWSTGCMDPKNRASKPVLCIGQALGIPHRTKAPGVRARNVFRAGRQVRVEWWIWEMCAALAPDMKQKDAFAEIARDLCVGVETVKQIYLDFRRALRADGFEVLPWPRQGKPHRGGLVRLR